MKKLNGIQLLKLRNEIMVLKRERVFYSYSTSINSTENFYVGLYDDMMCRLILFKEESFKRGYTNFKIDARCEVVTETIKRLKSQM